MKFEDVLDLVGSEDRYQFWLITFLLLPTSFFNSFYESLLMLSKPDHWCRVPQLQHLSEMEQHALIRPYNNDTGTYSTCERYDIDYDHVRTLQDLQMIRNNMSGHISTVSCSEGWLFDKSLYSETAITWVSVQMPFCGIEECPFKSKPETYRPTTC